MHSLSRDEGDTGVKSRVIFPDGSFTVALLTVVIVPLIILPGVLFFFDVTPKVVALLLGVALLLLCGTYRNYVPVSGATRWLAVLLGAQVVSLLFSTLVSPDRALSFTGTNWRRFGFLTQCAVLLFAWMLSRMAALQPGSRIRWVFRVTAAAGILAGAYGIAQYFRWDPWLPAAAYHVGEGAWTIVRPPATLGHADYFATYLLYAVFAGASLWKTENGPLWKWLGPAAACIASAAIVLSGTRAGIVGLAAGILFALLWFRPRISRGTVTALLLLLAGSAAFYLSPAGMKLRGRIRWTVEDAYGGARLLLWRDTSRMAGGHLAVGIGPETFTSYFARYRSAELARTYPDFYQESPHNIFLDALAAQGLPGMLILVSICTMCFAALRKANTADPRLTGFLGASFLAGLVSLQFSSFVLPTALYFYLTTGMIVALVPRPPDNRQKRASRGAAIGWYAAALAAAVLLANFSFRLLATDRQLELTRDYLDAGRIRVAAQAYQLARDWQPRGMSADLWFSRSMASAAQKSPDVLIRLDGFQVALEAASRAAANSEDLPNAWYNLAAFHARRDDLTKTEESLRRAIASSPTWYKPHWMLAQLLRAAGRVADARTEAKLAVELGGSKHPEVVRTWEELKGLPQPGASSTNKPGRP